MFCLWSFLIIFAKQSTKYGLKIQKWLDLKDCKSCQENVSLSLAKRKLAEKINKKFLINQVRSCMLPYSAQITERASLAFRLPYLEYDFMIANLVD